MITDNI